MGHILRRKLMTKSCANEMEAKWIFPFMLVSIAFVLLRAETALAASNISISYQGCNQNKTCLSTPDKCDPAASGSCFFLSAGWPLNSTNITFELSGQSSGYIAVAFSKNNQMDNDSNIYACASDSGVKLIHTTLSNRSSSTLGNSSSEALVRGSVNGSTIQCVFTVRGLNIMKIMNSFQLNISNIFLIKGNFINGTLGSPINSTAGLNAVPSAIPSSTALGANNTTTLGGNKGSNITTTTTNTNNNITTTTTNTNNNNTTTTSTNNNNNTAATTTTINTATTTTNKNTAAATTKSINTATTNTNNTATTSTNNTATTTTNNTATTTNKNTAAATTNSINTATTNTNNTTTTTTNNINTTTNTATTNNNTASNTTATTTNTATTNNKNNTAAATNNSNTTSNTTATTNSKTTTTNNSGGSALQSTSAKAPLVLIGAIVVALLSG
ncbi:hypothetical protein SRHO_G00255740 [Serrasalmus rhombeus]